LIDFWHLEKVDWLNALPREAAEALRLTARLQNYPRGALIFEPAINPDHVYLLESGLVRIYRESLDAEQVTFGYVNPGEVFGECAVFQPSQRESFASAHETSEVLRLSRECFAAVVRSHPSILFAVAKQIEGRFKKVESRVEDLVFRNARSRLARSIIQLSKEFGRFDGERTILHIRLTHGELAMLIGSSRPTVSIALGELEDEGVVARVDRYIAVTDPETLKKIAEV
jgi:CRP-like cAMP-binding protein